MITEAVLITTSCVLFVQMGLSDAIQEATHIYLKVASCPKCLSFWSTLAYFLFTQHGFIVSIAASFLCAYAALWLSLLYDALALLYNYAYECLTETDTTEDAEAVPDESTTATATDEVS